MCLEKDVLLVIIVLCAISGILLPSGAASESLAFHDMQYYMEEYPPFNFVLNGTPTGLAVDLLGAITREAGDPVSADQIRLVTLEEGLDIVKNTPGSVIFSIARIPPREDDYLWAGPLGTYDIVLFSRNDGNITISSDTDLRKYTVGAVASDASIEELMRRGVDKDQIKTDPDPEVLFTLLEEGAVDLVITGDIAGESVIRRINKPEGSYRIVYRLDSIPLYYAFSPKTPESTVSLFQDSLDRILEPQPNGSLSEYNRIKRAWQPYAMLSSVRFYTEEYYPMNFLQNETPAGISVDILNAVFDRLNIPHSDSQVSLGPWEEGYETTLRENGTALFSMARSPEREKLFLWAGPVYEESVVIFSTADNSDLSRDEDWSGLRIGAIRDDIAALDLERMGFQNIVYASDAKTLIAALEGGTIDGWAYAKGPGFNLISRYASDPENISPVLPLEDHEYYYGFNLNTPLQVVQEFQNTLDQLKKEKDSEGMSVYDRIIQRYQNSSPLSLD